MKIAKAAPSDTYAYAETFAKCAGEDVLAFCTTPECSQLVAAERLAMMQSPAHPCSIAVSKRDHAYAELMRISKGYRRAGPKLTEAGAFSLAMSKHPDLAQAATKVY